MTRRLTREEREQRNSALRAARRAVRNDDRPAAPLASTHRRYRPDAAHVRENFKESLESLEKAYEDSGALADWDEMHQAVQIARQALKLLSQTKPAPSLVATVRRMHAGLMHNDERKRPARPFFTIPELAKLNGMSRFAMKRYLDRWSIPYAADPGGRNYKVFEVDLLKIPETACLAKRSYQKGGAGLNIAIGRL